MIACWISRAARSSFLIFVLGLALAWIYDRTGNLIAPIVMIDQGGNGNGNGDGHQSGINRFAQTGPTVIFSLLQQLQALGL